MKLKDIFDQLVTSEFSQLSIGGSGPGVIDEGNQAKVVNHINLALMALYRRFNLKEGRLALALQAEQLLYHLKSAFAVNSRTSREPVRYILDTEAARFQDDILKVEKVLDADECELPLNDAADPLSVFTPSALTLRVPEALETQNLTVVYRATHPKIVVGLGYFDPARVEVELPDSHLDALLYFVASRANNPVGMTNEFHAGNSYYAKYEAACQELENKGLQVDQGQQIDKIKRGGWA